MLTTACLHLSTDKSRKESLIKITYWEEGEGEREREEVQFAPVGRKEQGKWIGSILNLFSLSLSLSHSLTLSLLFCACFKRRRQLVQCETKRGGEKAFSLVFSVSSLVTCALTLASRFSVSSSHTVKVSKKRLDAPREKVTMAPINWRANGVNCHTPMCRVNGLHMVR